jgi:bifunctional UDP-N-acetylglucosamine pyrophosphorylase / glucosamine-1-phosphate N-acetyltransferase
MVKNQFVILAAGKGTRMGNGNVPKVLVMLKEKPIILYLISELEKINQLIKPVIVTGYMANKVEGVLGDNFLYAYQDKQLGTAHALMAARRKIRAENILVLYGDMPFVKADTLSRLVGIHLHSGNNISICTAQVENFKGKNENFESFGRVLRDPVSHLVAQIVEAKDANENQKKIKEVNAGIYMFNTKWLWENISKIQNQNAQKEFYLTDIVGLAICQNQIINSLLINPREAFGINSKEDLEIAEKMT